jgi:formylglycine-generating enzyme required for sulfatase activity
MYCGSCNTEFPEGLRYCKWCGQALLPGSGNLSESGTCPGCGWATQPDWAYCRRCGARLVADRAARTCPRCYQAVSPQSRYCPRCGQDLMKSLSRATTTMAPSGGFCQVCGEQLSSGLRYCKGCGSAVATSSQYAQQPLPEHSSVLCAVCHSHNPPGSSTCKVCGAVFIGAATNPGTSQPINPSARQDISAPLAAESEKSRADPSPSAQAPTSVITKSKDTNPIEAVERASEQSGAEEVGLTATGQTADDLIARWPSETRAGEQLPVVETTEVHTGYFVPGETPPTIQRELPAVRDAYTGRLAQAVTAQKSTLIVALIAALLIVIAVAAYLGRRFVSGAGDLKPASSQSHIASPVDNSQPTLIDQVPAGMVLVKAGDYVIGRDDGDIYARPKHIVTLSAFYIDRTEVTNAEYKKFVDATGHKAPEGWQGREYPQGQGDLPVTGVSWQDAADFAAWAGKRLPTEAEWEAAARGTDGRIYPWGNQWQIGLANIGTSGIVEVGRYKEGASPVGALDMIGNVWEWTADEFKLYPGSTAPMPASIKPGKIFRVIRGGAYDGNKMHDATYRGFVDASRGYDKTGFRCAKSANPMQ